MKPFDFVDSASSTKVDLVKNSTEHDPIKGYSPWLTNRHFSLFNDSVMYANEMNLRHHLDPYLQYRYYLAALNKRTRKSRWLKPEDAENVEFIARRYSINRKTAREIIRVLGDQEVAEIVREMKKEEEHVAPLNVRRDRTE